MTSSQTPWFRRRRGLVHPRNDPARMAGFLPPCRQLIDAQIMMRLNREDDRSVAWAGGRSIDTARGGPRC